jgi:DNA (cytosine-5)-methyltransferase 1
MTGNVLLPGCRERAWEPGEDYERRPSGIWVPGELVERPPPAPSTAVDLFAGAGGMSCGFHQAGIHVVGASEAWHDAAVTYLVNLGFPGTQIHVLDLVPDKGNGKRARKLHELHAGTTITAAELLKHHGAKQAAGSGWISQEAGHTVADGQCGAHQDDDEKRAWFHETYCLGGRDYAAAPCLHLWLGDVRQLTGERMLEDLGMELGELGIVAGGPPCQGFSISGKRDVVDPRNSLVFEFARLVLELRPQTMLMENVSGMVSMVTPEGIPVVDALCHVLEEGGFGGYDALRKSLLTSSGAGGAVRTKRRGKSEAQEAPTGDEQLDIFEALGAVA